MDGGRQREDEKMRGSISIRSIVCTLVLGWLASPLYGHTTIYVDADAAGPGNGSSWSNAFNDLQDALAAAGGGGYQIWVAAGTYTPDAGTGDRTVSFELVDNVALYGGFAGWETSLSQRNPAANETTLSGDLMGNDGSVFAGRADNSRHVVIGSGISDTAVLDGFTVSGGFADMASGEGDGGGMRTISGSPTVRGCLFEDNMAEWGMGGGMYNLDASPEVVGCTFTGNMALGGLGMFNEGQSHPDVTACVFHDNSMPVDEVTLGGGMFNLDGASPTIRDCLFTGNSVWVCGGVSCDGAANATLINCVFTGNESTDSTGGAVFATNDSHVSLINCTLSGNWASDLGGGLYFLSGSTVSLSNCVLWGNVDSSGTTEEAQIYDLHGPGNVTIDYSCVQGWTGSFGGVGNIGDDPLYIDADGGDDLIGTLDDNPRITPGASPCIDAGDNGAVPPDVMTDFDGNDRFIDDPSVADTGSGTPPLVDIGAFEAVADCNGNGVPDAQDIASGTSEDCNGNEVPDECETDCNENGVPDDCDIAAGTSEDVNGNGQPDECEGDCNNNGIPDGTDILDGTSEDCNANDVPDECEGDCNGNGVPDDCDILGGFSADEDLDGIPDECARFHVRVGATGANDGSSWTDAYTDLQDAIARASMPGSVEYAVWVAAGTYTPDGGTGDRALSFDVEGVSLYGGFAGYETAIDQRDPAANQTILSGDLSGDDLPGFVNREENSLHVAVCIGPNAWGILDGFVIEGGYADGSTVGPDGYGGGMYNEESHPTVENCIFRDNAALPNGWGGGMYNFNGAHPTVSDCTFTGNDALAGLGMFNEAGSHPMVIDSVFIANVGLGSVVSIGGGMVNFDTSSPTVINCLFAGNIVDIGGGTVADMFSEPLFINCIFTGNVALDSTAGAVFNTNEGRTRLFNCTISGNTASGKGGGVYNLFGGMVTIENCIIWGNSDAGGTDESAQVHHVDSAGSTTANYSCIQGLTGALGGVGNIGDDPMLRDPDGSDDVLGTTDDNVRVFPGLSPALDAGDDNAVPVTITFDYDHGVRFADDPVAPDTGNGSPPIVDMGAFEYQADCNGNGVIDSGDIADGTSLDENGDGVPDECLLVDPPIQDTATKNRYVSLRAGAPVAAGLVAIPQALRVTSPDLPGFLKWVQAPDANGISRLGCDPAFIDWGNQLVHVGDYEIMPNYLYILQGILEGADIGDEAAYSDPTSIPTVPLWGDIVGMFEGVAWTPPNGDVNFMDINAAVQAFQSLATAPPLVWVDVAGDPPNGLINFVDIDKIVRAFQGGGYPFDGQGVPCP